MSVVYGGHGIRGLHTFFKQRRDLQSAASSHDSPSSAPFAFGSQGSAHLLSSHKSMAHSSLLVQVALTSFFSDWSASLSSCGGGAGWDGDGGAGGDGDGGELRGTLFSASTAM